MAPGSPGCCLKSLPLGSSRLNVREFLKYPKAFRASLKVEQMISIMQVTLKTKMERLLCDNRGWEIILFVFVNQMETNVSSFMG